MFVELQGEDTRHRPLRIRWTLVAERGDGPEIPAIPAVIIAGKLAAGRRPESGARPCLGLFTLAEFMNEVGDLASIAHRASS